MLTVHRVSQFVRTLRKGYARQSDITLLLVNNDVILHRNHINPRFSRDGSKNVDLSSDQN